MSNKHLDTSAEMLVITCDCGHRIEKDGPKDESVVMTFRLVCPACDTVIYSQYVGEKAYKPRPDTMQLQFGIHNIFAANGLPMTVRQVFYRAEVLGMVPKTEQGYAKVQRQLMNMRRSGSIGYAWLADGTRWRRKPQSYGGLADALERMQEYYRRDFWAEQPVYVEIWLEKDALAGVIFPVTSEFDVPLMVSRGFSSASYIHESAEHIKAVGKPAYIYHFGDHDADGVKAAESIQAGLLEHGAEVHFERVAVTEEQIRRLNLPTRPQKQSSPNAKKWGNKPACELDAIPPATLRSMVRACITRHVDQYEWQRMVEIQAAEQETLKEIVSVYDLPSFDDFKPYTHGRNGVAA